MAELACQRRQTMDRVRRPSDGFAVRLLYSDVAERSRTKSVSTTANAWIAFGGTDRLLLLGGRIAQYHLGVFLARGSGFSCRNIVVLIESPGYN